MMNVWGITDTGLVRHENQDAYAVRVCEDSGFTVCVVCDGMGGPGGGKLASELAVETFMSVCLDKLSPEMDLEGAKQVAESAVAAANAAVYERSCEGSMRGMGTTLVSALVRDGRALLNNVGDSRAYLIRSGGDIARITKDHSLVERLVDRGDITAEEARTYPGRNLITRALGPDPEAPSDSYEAVLEAGDCLLLCTDGLIETATDQEMAAAVLEAEDGGACLERLLELARSRGAPDNVTAVLLRQQ